MLRNGVTSPQVSENNQRRSAAQLFNHYCELISAQLENKEEWQSRLNVDDSIGTCIT